MVLRIKQWSFLMGLPVFISCIFLLCMTQVHAAGLNKTETEYLKKKATLVFVCQTHYPPFEFSGPDGDHTGICIDLVRWIATEFGFKAHFTDTSFKEAQESILSGKADVLTSFFYSEKRDERFDFTQTMFKVPASIFVVSERPDIKEMMDLQGKIIAMQTGDYAQEFLEAKKIRCFFKYTKNFAEATDLVIAGEADAVIGDEQIVLYHIFSNNLTRKIKKVGEPLYVGQNCMGLKDSNRMLTDIMNKGIDLARKKGVIDQIYQKWLGTPYSSTFSRMQAMLPYFYILLGSAVLLSILFWIWNLKLRKNVLIRTAALSRSETTLRAILDASPLGIGLGEGRTIIWNNPAMSRMLGYEPGELLGQKIDRIYHDSSHLELSKQHLAKAMHESSGSSFETRWVRKDGSHFDCRVRLAPFQLENKSRVIAIAEDISRYKLADEKLKENEAFLNAIVENIPDMIFVKDATSLKFVRFNKAGEELIGFSRDDLIGKNDYDFFPPEQADFFTQNDQAVLESGHLLDIPEESINTRHKGIRILHTKKLPIHYHHGKPQYLLGISEDITERKQTEHRVIASLKEKEMLLKEIHHRVKNNMQVISSLLSLQADTIEDRKASDAFADTEIRVQSMAFVHEILYQSENLSEIRLQVYLDNLVNHLFHVYRLGTGPADIEIDAGDVVLTVDHAVPCGLIVTELVTNSLKYAVPADSSTLSIHIKAAYEPGNRVAMTIADNGCGLPSDFDLHHAGTLGIKLVDGLITDQLEGTWRLDNRQPAGTCWLISWPVI